CPQGRLPRGVLLPLDAGRGIGEGPPRAGAAPGTPDRLYDPARLRLGADLLPRIADRRWLEAHAEAGADVVDALVLLGETAIRDVIDKRRDLPAGHEFIAKVQRLPEQHVRTEALAVGPGAADLAIVEARPEEVAEDNAVAGPKHVAGQPPRPVGADIRLICITRSVDLTANRWPRLHRPADPRRHRRGPGVAD